MLSAGRVQGLVRPVTSHERCRCSHDASAAPASPPAGLLPISRRASKPVAKSGVDAVRVETISLDLRDHPEEHPRPHTMAVNESDDAPDAPEPEQADTPYV